MGISAGTAYKHSSHPFHSEARMSNPLINNAGSNESAGQGGKREDMIFVPSSKELERLLFAIESSLQINRRFQFFLWSHGVLQALLPHQTLLCVSGNIQAGAYHVDVFASDAVNHSAMDGVDESIQVLTDIVIERWLAGNGAPLAIGVDDENFSDTPLREALLESGLGNIMAMGTKEFKTQGSFFIFGRLERKAGRRSFGLFELLLPVLHFALHRYFAHEASETDKPQFLAPALSDREIQIIQSVCTGKTNFEIGVDLDISPLTVKNHMQRILKKLGVNNRAQAVARCIELGLF
jgi:transcriptional regulator EpsA